MSDAIGGNALHNADTGEALIYTLHNRDVLLLDVCDPAFVGREGIELFHRILRAVRDAETFAFIRGHERAIAVMRRHLNEEADKV